MLVVKEIRRRTDWRNCHEQIYAGTWYVCRWANTKSHMVHGTTWVQKVVTSIPKVVAPGSIRSNLILLLMFFPQLWPVFIQGSSTEFPDVSATLSQRTSPSLSRETVVHIALQPVATSHFKPSVHITEGKEAAPYLCLLLLIPITKIPQSKWPCYVVVIGHENTLCLALRVLYNYKLPSCFYNIHHV